MRGTAPNRAAAVVVAALGIALVLAQDLAPRSALYHTWQYALALTIALAVVAGYALSARRGADGPSGRRLLVAMAGAAVVVVAGLASGLLGPDTAEVAGTPGTVVPVPALGAAAFFGAADERTIATGSASVTLRRRGGRDLVVGANPHVLGESLAYLEPRDAAFVQAWGRGGVHLTITQPTNGSFLSPVLLFRNRQAIGSADLPFDTFAVPAEHVVFHALYVTAADLAHFGHGGGALGPNRPGLIVTAASDTGTPLGIALIPSGGRGVIGGITLAATLGTYPALAVGAAPPTWALVLGLVLFVAGIAWAGLHRDGPATAVTSSAPAPG